LHIVVTVPGLLDPQLMAKERCGVKVLVHAPRRECFEARYGSRTAFERLQRRVFATIARRTGLNLNAHARVLDRATPATLERRTGNTGGAMYGLDAACGQVGPQRPPNRTRLDNLLWVGHYTRPSHGIVGSAMAGRFAADIVCARLQR
jgi:phytoene dehydrogenase-like protein